MNTKTTFLYFFEETPKIKIICDALRLLVDKGYAYIDIALLDTFLQSYGHNFPQLQDLMYNNYNCIEWHCNAENANTLKMNNPFIIKIYEFILQKQYNLGDEFKKKSDTQHHVKNDFYIEHYSKSKQSKSTAKETKKKISNALNSKQLNCLLELELQK